MTRRPWKLLSLGVLAAPISRDTGWSRGFVFLGFTVALLSDFHYDPYFSLHPLHAAVPIVNNLHPDLLVQQALQALDHARIVLGDHLPHLDTGIQQSDRGNDLIEKTDALRLLGSDDPSGVEQLLRLRQADQQRQ